MALLVVLWVMTLLAVLAAGLVRLSGGETLAARRLADQAQGEACAEAGIALARIALLDPRPERRWQRDGRPYRLVWEGDEIEASIQDEDGKIDLNTAADELLVGLFASAGLPRREAEALVDAIGDWRDPDDLKRLHGAEVEDYRLAGLAYGPRNRSFESVEELALVLGMSPEVLRQMTPALTVYSGERMVDLATANTAARQALALRASSTPPAGPPGLAPPGRSFSLAATCRTAGSRGAMRREIVRMTGEPRHPLAIMATH